MEEKKIKELFTKALGGDIKSLFDFFANVDDFAKIKYKEKNMIFQQKTIIQNTNRKLKNKIAKKSFDFLINKSFRNRKIKNEKLLEKNFKDIVEEIKNEITRQIKIEDEKYLKDIVAYAQGISDTPPKLKQETLEKSALNAVEYLLNKYKKSLKKQNRKIITMDDFNTISKVSSLIFIKNFIIPTVFITILRPELKLYLKYYYKNYLNKKEEQKQGQNTEIKMLL